MVTDRVDALVIFGATGDLAKLETFPALVGLVDRGVLDVPVVGVAKSGWGLDAVPRVRRRLAAAQRHRPGRGPAAAKMLALLRYVDGDLDDPATYAAMSRRWRREAGAVLPGGAAVPVRPDRPGHLRRRPRRRCPGDGGEAVRDRPASARELNETMHAVLPRGRHLPGRPLARPGPAQQRAGGPVRQRGVRAAAQPRPRREHPDHHGRGVRRRRPWPLLRRPAPSATSCRTTCCRCWPACWPTHRTARAPTPGWTPRRGSSPRCGR